MNINLYGGQFDAHSNSDETEIFAKDPDTNLYHFDFYLKSSFYDTSDCAQIPKSTDKFLNISITFGGSSHETENQISIIKIYTIDRFQKSFIERILWKNFGSMHLKYEATCRMIHAALRLGKH